MVKLKFILITLVYFVLTNLLFIFGIEFLEDSIKVNIPYSDIIITLIIFFLVTGFVLLSKTKFYYKINFSKALISLVGIPFFLRVFNDVFIRIEILLGYNDYPIFDNSPKETGTILYNFFVLILLVPIYEELFFRGYIIKKLKIHHNIRSIVIFSSLLFALIHINPYNMDWTFFKLPIPFLLGVSTSLVYVWGKSIIYPILLHIGYNSYIFIIYGEKYWALEKSLNFNYLYFFIILLSIIAVIIQLYWFYKTKNSAKKENT